VVHAELDGAPYDSGGLHRVAVLATAHPTRAGQAHRAEAEPVDGPLPESEGACRSCCRGPRDHRANLDRVHLVRHLPPGVTDVDDHLVTGELVDRSKIRPAFAPEPDYSLQPP